MTTPETSAGESFVRLHLEGGRFDAGNGMPVEAIAELIAYEELLQAMARRVFLRYNPGRQRVPVAFRERLSLRLTRVEGGSVVPVLDRVPAHGELAVPDEFTSARDEIGRVIEQAITVGAVDLPDDVFHAFARFGQSLRIGERIMLLPPGQDRGPTYDAETRKRLMLAREQSYTRSVTLVASIFDLNAENRTFRARLEDGTALMGDYDTEAFELLKQALRPNPDFVELDCVVRYNAEERPVRIVSVHDLTIQGEGADTVLMVSAPTLPTAVQARLAELRRLDQGWLDGTGDAVTTSALRAVRTLLLAIGSTFEPRLYPTDEGGVRAEWTLGETDLSVEIGADGSFYAHALNLTSQSDDEAEAATVDEAAVFLTRWLR